MKDFKYIIWHQGSTSTSDSTMIFVDNNDNKLNLSVEERQEVFGFISTSNRHEWKKLKVANPNTRLKVYKDNSGNVLISSHFEETDEDGRRIVFIFCTKKMDWKSIAAMLSLAANETGKTVQPTDLKNIEKIKSWNILKPLLSLAAQRIGITAQPTDLKNIEKIKSRNILKPTLITLITIIIIYIIWKNFQA